MVKYLVMDVDGTLTDGKIYMSENGELMKAFSIKDGCGIKMKLIPYGIIPIIITGRYSIIVLNRCKELGISELYQGVTDKTKTLLSLTEDLSSVAFIGDDLNDLDCMKAVKTAGGIVGCPKDAAKEVICFADFVSDKYGGDGAVRDFIEYIVDSGL